MELNIANIKKYTSINLGFFLVSIILIILCYSETLYWMYHRYMGADSYYTHGFLVPFVSGFLIWQKRREIRNITLSGSVIGLFLICFAVVLHIGGVVLYIYFISGVSLFLIILGIVLYTFGKKITKAIIFPICFILFMIPLPMHLIEKISFPMKMMVAETGVMIVRLMGIPVLREGFHIWITSGSLLIGNPCSGLRSLIAFLAIGALIAYFGYMNIKRKLIVLLSAIPIAIFSNIIRVIMLILISQYFGLEVAAPETYLHTGSGICTFALGFISLYFVSHLMERV